ncbi:MAG: heterodisulfide reductase-related iron-sulfur binding cluster [Tepidisphaeraceae bacterium]|jgi:glycolate oxidase iron-sulfur subunit
MADSHDPSLPETLRTILPACVHCGLCLPACPTYNVTLHEADSPRGRLQLMLGLSTGEIKLTASVQNHLDLCLDCRGCETICPSGVKYHHHLERAREDLAPVVARTAAQRLVRWMSLHILTHPARLKLAVLPARLLQSLGVGALIGKLLPLPLAKMQQMLPRTGPLWTKPLPALTEPKLAGEMPPPRVALLSGCVGSVLFDGLNRMAIDLLAAAGAQVLVPPSQGCCGAIHHHNSEPETARQLARRNLDAFMPAGQEPPQWITTAIAGCGAMLREYDRLLAGDPHYAERAREFVRRTRDISEVLLDLGLPPMSYPVDATVTYHDACHLAHAQRVTAAPRKLLAAIPGIRLVPLPESDLCCGAAGTYNLMQPAMAGELASRKLRNIRSTSAGYVAAGNAGCALHIQSHARQAGMEVQVVHPIELLHRAVFGKA